MKKIASIFKNASDASASAPKMNLNAYHKLDVYWKATADFLQSHMSAWDRLIAPDELARCHPDRQCNTYRDKLSNEYQWIALHKSLIKEAEAKGLLAACLALEPVFANEVFVLFATRNRAKPVTEKNVHYQQFLKLLTEEFLPTLFAKAEAPGALPRNGATSNVPATYLGNNRALIRTVHGQKMYVDTRDLVSGPHLILDGYWEGRVSEELANHLKDGATVIEVGANMGYYTLLAASKVGPTGKVISFEANPDLCALVHKSIEINGFSDYCEVINKAATDKAGTVSFQRWKEHTGLSSIAFYNQEYVRQNYDSVDEISVETVSLDSFLEERGVLHVDVIKIDAEGCEPLIFKGLKNTFERNEELAVIFELNPMSRTMGLDLTEMVDGFLKDGFSLDRIDAVGLTPIESAEETVEWRVCDVLMRKRSSRA